MSGGVSVVIPAYNAARWLEETLEGALSQTLPADEIIVVDDGSTDSTPEIVRGYGERVVLLQQENAGVAAARNNGVRHTSGRLLAFLDADDVWLPRKLEHQVERFEAEPDLGLVYVGIEEVDGDGRTLGVVIEGREGWLGDDFLLARPVTVGGGSGAMVRRDLFEEVGGFDVRLSTSADWDLYGKIGRRARIGFVPHVLLRYRVHDAGMHKNIDAMCHDKLLALETAFDGDQSVDQRLRRRAFANTHLLLAGSYLQVGRRGSAVRHVLRGVAHDPAVAARAAALPLRKLRRRRAR